MSKNPVVNRILSNLGKQAKTPGIPTVSYKPPAKRSTPGPGTVIQTTAEKSPKKTAEPIAYFDSSRGAYWHKNARNEWIQLTEASLRRILKYNHFADVTDKDLQFAVIDKHFIELQREHDVAYAGAIAGYKAGLHQVCGQRILVTSGPRLLQWKEGGWVNVRTFLETLLGNNVRELYGWLKAGLRSLYAGPPFRPGQMLALAGPAGCGKSLFQNLLTEMFGGRSAKPYRYMTGETAFNSDLLQNEHLMIEDEAASTDLRIRRHFGSQLKNMIVNEVQSLHRKGRDALSVTPFWRVTITLNDEPENLAVLPPLDESLVDKLTLLRATPFRPPYAPDDIPARNAWRAKLSAELPAFMHWLRSWRVPERMVNVRYGVEAYQDPGLLQELHDLAPEAHLLALIDELQICGTDYQPWVGTSDELTTRLLEKDKHGRVKALLSWKNAAGTYLRRLARKFSERIALERNNRHSVIFTIKPLPR